jgi:hypothetical protein
MQICLEPCCSLVAFLDVIKNRVDKRDQKGLKVCCNDNFGKLEDVKYEVNYILTSNKTTKVIYYSIYR